MTDKKEAEIGAAGPTFQWIVERGKISEFARACLNDGDAYDADGAVAPPTFPQTTSFWQRRSGGAGGRPRLARPFDPRRLLHGEQEFEYLRPLRAGERLSGQTKLKDYYEKEGKRGGVMRFAVFETEFRDEAGDVVAYSRGTSIETAKPATS
jgi:hypothetical protein